MVVKQIVIDVLLSIGVLVQLLSCIGVLFMPNLMDRLHFLSPATSVGPWFVAAAIVIEEAFAHQGIFAVIVAGFLLLFGPVLTHATARAARIRQRGDWRVQPDESVRRP
jgi:monovalent cation/proton antiporter MnhG/PhaG subunit